MLVLINVVDTCVLVMCVVVNLLSLFRNVQSSFVITGLHNPIVSR